jgi:histone H3/H4
MNDSALHRIYNRAGGTRISGSVYDQIREVGEKYLSAVVNYAIIFAEYENKKTISSDHVLHSIDRMGYISIYPISGDVKPCKISKKKKIITKIKEYQQQSDCYMFAKAPIEAQIKQISNKTIPGFKWAKDALMTLQLALEFTINKIFVAAIQSMVNCGRTTLQYKDVDLVVSMVKLNCANVKLEL